MYLYKAAGTVLVYLLNLILNTLLCVWENWATCMCFKLLSWNILHCSKCSPKMWCCNFVGSAAMHLFFQWHSSSIDSVCKAWKVSIVLILKLYTEKLSDVFWISTWNVKWMLRRFSFKIYTNYTRKIMNFCYLFKHTLLKCLFGQVMDI